MTDDPAPDRTPRLYRMLRDTLYHTAGSIVSLLPEQVRPHEHELVTIPPGDQGDAGLTERVAALTARVDRLEEAAQSGTVGADPGLSV